MHDEVIKIREHIETNNFGKVFSALKQVSPSGFHNQISSLKGRYNQLIREENDGILNTHDAVITRNKIRKDTLSLLDRISESIDAKKRSPKKNSELEKIWIQILSILRGNHGVQLIKLVGIIILGFSFYRIFWSPQELEVSLNNSSQNKIVINNTKGDKYSTINHIYYADENQETTRTINLVNLTDGVSTTTYHGTTTFLNCSFFSEKQGFDLTFSNFVNSLPPGIINYTIKWGDGTPNLRIKDFSENDTITHTFYYGNTIVQVESIDSFNRSQKESYNVFIGNSPAIGISSFGTTKKCLKDPYEFEISSFQFNSPWTLYTLAFDDGSEPYYFIRPQLNESRLIKHYFDKVSDNDSGYYIATVTAENPCDQTSATINRIFVRSCD